MSTRQRVQAFALGLSLLLTMGSAGAHPVIYRVINLGNPLGGTVSQGTSINNRNWVTGFAELPGDGAMHAELWRDGGTLDLGTLGGPNSAVAWPNRNDHGEIAGIAETAALNPLGEDWSCGLAVFPTVTGHICRGFVWKNGRRHGLPTLGGYDGFATGINNRGEIVGWAEDNIHDPTCDAFNQILQFEAVLWVRHGNQYQPQELPPYPGDLDGAATAINQDGEVVGISGICGGAVGGATAEHMVMWRDGRVLRNLPTLGGSYWNTPMDINNRGNVVGFSDLPGDGPTFAGANFQAFYWSRKTFLCNGKMKTGTCDLGVLAGNQNSEALGINERDQVVGVSFNGTASPAAFIWQDGVMTNLNSLVAPGTTLVLTDAQEINDRGVITGQALVPSTGALVAFMAIPITTNDSTQAQ